MRLTGEIRTADETEFAAETLSAMRSGADVIVQAVLAGDGWGGRADILWKVSTPSALGAWSYEAVDTKLARETKGGTVLQLCLYSDLIRRFRAVGLLVVVFPLGEARFEEREIRAMATAVTVRADFPIESAAVSCGVPIAASEVAARSG